MVATKEPWSCDNQCGASCCEELFLPLTPTQKTEFLKTRAYRVPHDYTDFRWLSFHRVITLSPVVGVRGMSLISLRPGVDFAIKRNPHSDSEFLYVASACSHLLPNNECDIYADRPNICKTAECPVFTIRKRIAWFAENGKLREARAAHASA